MSDATLQQSSAAGVQTVGSLLAVAMGGAAESPAAIDAVGAHRRAFARAFLGANRDDPGLPARQNDIAELAASGFPWDPGAEDYALSEAILARWTAPAPPPNVIMAAMALAPAHHFPAPPRLADVPAWLRPLYVRYLLARAPIFFEPGEADRYAAHGAATMTAVHAAIFEDRLPDADDLARAVCQADATTIFFNARSLKSYFRDKALICEWAMLRQGHALGLGIPLRRADGPPRIGILHRTLQPGTETFHLLAYLEGRERADAKVTLYVLDAPQNALVAPFEPWVDAIVQLPAGVPAAVARVRADDLDLCFSSNNLGWGLTRETMIAAHRLARVQVVSGACPASPGYTSADHFLSSQSNDPSPEAQDDYAEKLAFVAGAVGHFGFGHDAEPPTLTATRAAIGVPDAAVLFFSGANYYKITPEMLQAWAEILACTPGSSLALMPFNPNWQANYPLALFLRRLNRQLVRFGVAPSRVRLIGQVPTRADLMSVMRLADIYLDTFPYSGACSLVDPLLVGLPIVARAGTRLRTAQGGSMLSAEGLPVSPDNEAYVERAVALAHDPERRKAEAAKVGDAARRGLACLKTAPFAKRFFAFCGEAIDARARAAAALRTRSVEELTIALSRAVATARADGAPAFRRFLDLDVARQLLLPWLQTLAAEGRATGRIVDIGACLGEMSLPFLNAGFRADLFEPDPDCAARMAEIVAAYGGRAAHVSAAVVWAPASSVTFNKRAVGVSGIGASPYGGADTQITVAATTLGDHLERAPGVVDLVKIDAEGSDFDILRSIDLAAVAPKAIMVEYGATFPGQSAETVRALIAEMAAAGYGAVVFEYRMLEGFGRTNWDHELVDITTNADALGAAGDSFGNIVFFRAEDATLLAGLVSLVDNYGPAPGRLMLAG
ncbi:MAG TPA: FkbM family methyltransferase [Caulobacteraceae bacterium]|nr:FkbM family methyltransferase [Caulobacteraceae bacterium]